MPSEIPPITGAAQSVPNERVRELFKGRMNRLHPAAAPKPKVDSDELAAPGPPTPDNEDDDENNQ